MRFAKLHGLGNDFVLLDLRGGGQPLPAQRAIDLCDRHRGIGADGVLTLLPGRGQGSIRMLIQNSDGSIPEMCGNGARCAALWVTTGGGDRPGSGHVLIETEAGPRACDVTATGPRDGLVEVDMGVAEVQPARRLSAGSTSFEGIPVSVGNPHRVLFVDGPRDGLEQLARQVGPILCEAENANIELVSRLSAQRYAVSVWERGAGLTQACGTGACAVAAAAVARGEVRRGDDVTIELPGGTLTIRIDADNRVRMRGPAQLVFTGDLD